MILRYLLTGFTTLLLCGSLWAQVPQGINYQAILWDGTVLANQTLDVRFSIHQNSLTVYQETHFSATTNNEGLLVVQIGQGTPTAGIFSSLDWSAGPYSLRTEVDNGGGFVLMSDKPLQSVPYALFAQKTNLSAGPGLSLAGDTLINTGDTIASDDITNSTFAGGDLSGFYPAPEVVQLRGNPISPLFPGTNEVLKFNGAQWVPAPDDDTDDDSDPSNEIQVLGLSTNVLSLSNGGGSVNLPIYLAGPGIDITNNVVSNTGDINPGDDITFGTPAGGDLAGIYPDPVVEGIHGRSISNTPPLNNQVYKWNQSFQQWEPTNDAVNDADADPNNEIQTLSLSGNNLSLSNGGGTVNLPPYVGGTGIDITNNIISNTGLLTSTNFSGDLSGSYNILTVQAIQGNSVSTSSPSVGEILKWNGSEWIPATDNSSPWTETVDTLSHNGEIQLVNSSNQPRVKAGIDANDRGFLFVYDEFNVLQAGIQIDASGQGEVFGDNKNFRIPHPTQTDTEIWYASLEGPEAAAYTRGTAQLIDGKAVVRFPEHYRLVSQPESMTVMLTPLSAESMGLAVIEKTAEGFVVQELQKGRGHYSFDWEVKCVRQGHENYQVIRPRQN
jgi:hypothetical protein